MKIHTRAVHVGDRKKAPVEIPVTTPIYNAASFISEKTADLDRIFAHELEGYSYSRYGNPTGAALEELVASLEGGHGALACASGMSALEIAVLSALVDRPKSVVSADALYGATINLFLRVFEPLGVKVRYVDVCDLRALEGVIAEEKPGCVLMETISNPCLRVGAIDRIAALARASGAALIVDSTFATPLLVRPLELGAHFVVHSLTKYLAGHGDVLGGAVVTGLEHFENMRTLARTYGPLLGAFESYLAMRGIKTFPLRMERQCSNAARVAAWLRQDSRIERVIYLDDPAHPDGATIQRLFAEGSPRSHGELRGEGRGPCPYLRLHGPVEARRARHLARRRAHHDALPGDQLPPRDAARRARAAWASPRTWCASQSASRPWRTSSPTSTRPSSSSTSMIWFGSLGGISRTLR